MIRVGGVRVRVGDICELATPAGRHVLMAEVIGLAEHEAILAAARRSAGAVGAKPKCWYATEKTGCPVSGAAARAGGSMRVCNRSMASRDRN